MSTSTAIAAVTTTLVERLKKAMKAAEFGDEVTAGPPDAMRKGKDGPQLNLFLYQTAVDAGWRNQDIPGRPPGRKPLLPLRLHYLLTVYGHEEGDERPRHDERAHTLLGAAMLELHANPLVTAGDQPDPARVTLLPLTPDDVSKLWAGFQTPYRLSVAYEATPVLIEPTSPANSPLPVLARGGVTVPRPPGGAAAGGAAGGPAAGPAGTGKIEEVGIRVRPRIDDPTADLAVPPAGLRGLRLVDEPNPADPKKWYPDLLTLTGRGLAGADVMLLFTHPVLGAWFGKPTADPRRADDRLAVRIPHGLEAVTPYAPPEYDTPPPPPLPAGVVRPTADRRTWPPGEYTVAAATLLEVTGVDAAGTAKPLPKRLLSTTPVRFAVLPAVAGGGTLTFRTRPAAGGTVVFGAAAEVPLATPLPAPPADRVELFVGGRELSPTTVGPNDAGDPVVRWEAADARAAAELYAEIGGDAASDPVPLPAPPPAPRGPVVRIRVAGLDSPVVPSAASAAAAPGPVFDAALRVQVLREPEDGL